jgi:transcriptional regulator with XRE-family HTH domain
VGPRIREIRQGLAQRYPRAFSVAELARRIGVAERTLRHWERGTMRPTRRHAQALARELGVPVEALGIDGANQDDPRSEP